MAKCLDATLFKNPDIVTSKLALKTTYRTYYVFLIVMNFHDSFSLQTLTIRSDGESSHLHTIFDLNPYTKYTLFIQCGSVHVQCLSGWGALSGPVTGMTEEEGNHICRM